MANFLVEAADRLLGFIVIARGRVSFRLASRKGEEAFFSTILISFFFSSPPV